jgi:hypothetical protein
VPVDPDQGLGIGIPQEVNLAPLPLLRNHHIYPKPVSCPPKHRKSP